MLSVTDMTDPDWEPIMKKAAAIVTNRGGRTCHAAIVARELGIPAVVGCNNATSKIKNTQMITVSCAEGEIGYVYDGKLPFVINQISVKDLPNLPLKLCINLGNPDKAFATQFLPNDGVGLARLEFIISSISAFILMLCWILKNCLRKFNKKLIKKRRLILVQLNFILKNYAKGSQKLPRHFTQNKLFFVFLILNLMNMLIC